MFSKEESKQLREEFWGAFRTLSTRRPKAKRLPGDWLLGNTGVKAIHLRFHVDREVAMMKLEAFYREYRDFFKYV